MVRISLECAAGCSVIHFLGNTSIWSEVAWAVYNKPWAPYLDGTGRLTMLRNCAFWIATGGGVGFVGRNWWMIDILSM